MGILFDLPKNKFCVIIKSENKRCHFGINLITKKRDRLDDKLEKMRRKNA